MRILSPDQWDRHITGLRSFGIFASQAFEFEYNKNRTEGKTGIVKPDLIPTKSVDFSVSTNSNETSPKKTDATLSPKTSDPPPLSSATTAVKVPVASQNTSINLTEKNCDLSGLKKLSPTPKTSPRASPLKLIPEIDFVHEIVKPLSEPIESPVKSEKLTNNEINKQEIEPIVMSNEEQIETKLNEVMDAVKISSVKPKISARENGTSRPTLVRTKGVLIASKPPNVLVYADSAVTRDSVISTLSQILERDM